MPLSRPSSSGMENRGRPRERERRAPGVHKERSRERNLGRSGKHRSRTPTRAKPAPSRSSGGTVLRGREFERDRPLLHGARMDQEPSSRRNNDRDRSRDRDLLSSSKLRMDRDRDRDLKSTGSRDDTDRAKRGELDRVVKRAREERSSYWNKRVIEAEEKDPTRWGHSGFKELYRRDMNLERSPSTAQKSSRRTPERRKRKPESPKPPRRGGSSRSRSPRDKVSKSRSNNRRSTPTPTTQRSSAKSRASLAARKISPLMSREIPEPKILKERRVGGRTSDKPRAAEKRSDRTTISKSGGVRTEEKSTAGETHRSRGEKSVGQRNRRKSPSDSLSRSRSSTSPPAKVKRTGNSSSATKADSKGKDDWSRSTNNKKMSVSRSRSRSRSASSSSSSSEDGDVLELHANSRRRGRASTISGSSSSSSDEESKSNSSSSSVSSSKRMDVSGSSSSSSSSDSESDYESDISGKITMEGTKKPSRPSSSRSKESEQRASKTKNGEDESRSTAKRPSSGSGTVPSKPSRPTAPTPAAKATTRSKEKAASSKDSDSDSGSTSDSADSEPRMTLSERFAKLTQMSTDKREFAKPVLAVNEIDTKLKVVKDLRNADVKIYVDGQPRPGSGGKPPPRPKSPEYNYSEGEKRYSSDERRRYFERMARDEPRERPADWSDSRVRYEYYRDRGYFNERPITFEEYAKWEQWWYEYRDWLESEGYYPRASGSGPRGGHYGVESSRLPRGGEWIQPGPGSLGARLRPGPPPPSGGRRVEQVPVRMTPLSSRPHFTGRTEGRPVSGGRSIDRVPGGSLIVNIRQGSTYGPRGRHVGLIRGRNR